MWTTFLTPWFPAVLLAFYVFPGRVAGSDVCSTNNPGTPSPNAMPDPGLPDLATMTNGAFAVDAQVNLLEQSRTEWIRVFYDSPGNRAAVKLFANGMDTLIVFNYASDEVYYLNPGYYNCTVSRISGSRYSQLFGFHINNNLPHIGTLQEALKFGTDYNETYLGNTTVNGVPVYHWTSCINNTRKIDYYFNVAGNWTTSSTMSSVPVMSEVVGSERLPNGSLYNYHHIFTMSRFIPAAEFDYGDMQTPESVWCPGRKPGKAPPALPDRFYYKVEIVYPDLGAVAFEEVWYDASFKLFRHDRRPLVPTPPDYTTHPRIEIHDYTTGVAYTTDRMFNNCTMSALTPDQQDSQQNLTAYRYNQSYVLGMKSPLQLLDLDLNLTYIGQYEIRGIVCDAFVGQAYNFTQTGFLSNDQTMDLTFYFMADGWSYVTDDSVDMITSQIPIRLVLYSNDMALTATYNFLEFEPTPPSLSVFDVSACFAEANKVTFQVKFPGTYIPATEESVINWAQLVFAEKMGVSLLRVSGVQLSYDDANLYVTATLLDKTWLAAQFTVQPGRYIEINTGSIIYNSASPLQCASYCVNDAEFVCNSFDFCTNDQSCHLSPTHTDSGTTMSPTPSCYHYSRTVDGDTPQLTIASAFQNLRTSVYNRGLVLSNIGLGTLFKDYTADDVVVVFGWVNPNARLPQLSGQFSYKVEVSIPMANHVYSSQVWYDNFYKLLRYDPHVNIPTFPFYTTNPLRVVEDFNTGIRYVIDVMHQNCSISHLSATDFGVQTLSNNSLAFGLKDPLSNFRVDNTYQFVGQQTIRGMMCNIFESLRPNYQFMNFTTPAVFRYAFLADDWMETSDGYLGGDVGQPVRLEITILSNGLYMEYNFYDFDQDHPDASVFDVHQCYNPDQTTDFLVVFPGKFADPMGASSKIFLLEAVDKLVNRTGLPRMRLQRTRLELDDDFVYLYSSMVDNTDPLVYFTPIPNNPVPQHVDKVLGDPSTVQECARSCFLYTGFVCNSFYFCATSGQCLLQQTHGPGNGSVNLGQGCSSFSRTINLTTVEPPNVKALLDLRNAVYSGDLVLDIPVPNSEKTTTFTATTVDNVSKSRRKLIKEDSPLASFDVYRNSTCFGSDLADTMDEGLSLDECAQSCLTNLPFWCTGFSYQLASSMCSKTKTDLTLAAASAFRNATACIIYSRHYTGEYDVSSGAMTAAESDNVVPSTSPELCARQCSLNLTIPCRMFQYCPNTQQCRMFQNRALTGYALSNNTQATYVRSTRVGLYFCHYDMNCYLTVDLPGPDNSAVIASENGILCTQYNRQ
ncbi:uncharacterized protein LOC127867551 isoform X5 [Dreissena polymorpha]|uniref:uncharacterized protein LOC127867551 isoform X5 n=1 Tax=Dreissena polymorpha TaxID=45954 RepID=UPI0022653720|nr:uncharacterized protein LOC127867551 isoform X5 [Dreissena polymorpha]